MSLGQAYYLLQWGATGQEEWFEESVFSLYAGDEDVGPTKCNTRQLSYTYHKHTYAHYFFTRLNYNFYYVSICSLVFKCRKDKDKRLLQHRRGIIISIFPCGIIPQLDEMAGAEGATQVVGLVGDWVGSLPAEVRDRLKVWMYDDMCHLGNCYIIYYI